MTEQTTPALDIAKAARTGFTVKGVGLQVAQPFLEGHVLRPNEAAVLNQTYAENIRNNVATKVAGFLKEKNIETVEGSAVLSADQLAEIQATVEAYMLEYDFGVRRTGSGGGRISDPVEREARKNAKEKIKEAIMAAGHKLKDVGAEKINTLTEQHFTNNKDAFMAHAKKVLALKSDIGIGDLNLKPEAPAEGEAMAEGADPAA